MNSFIGAITYIWMGIGMFKKQSSEVSHNSSLNLLSIHQQPINLIKQPINQFLSIFQEMAAT